jgi:hypothetical protein
MGMGNNSEMSGGAGNKNGSIRKRCGRVSGNWNWELSGRQVKVWTSGTVIANIGRCKGRSGYHSMGMENIRIDSGKNGYQGMGIGNIRRDKGRGGYQGMRMGNTRRDSRRIR